MRFGVLILLLAAACTPVSPHRPTRPVVIRDARIFDPVTKLVSNGMVVIIEGDTILGVEHDAGVVPPPNAEIIDARGRMLLPGLSDLHGNFCADDERRALAAGVTNVVPPPDARPTRCAGGAARFHRQLAGWVEAGVSPVDALKAIARGTIAEGMAADLIMVEGDPTRDIRDLRRVVLTMKKGVVYD